MSDRITLTLRAPLDESIEADTIVPSLFASLGEAEIGALPIWAGRARRTAADYFDVRGGRSATVRIVGDVRRAHGIATGMSGRGANRLLPDFHIEIARSSWATAAA